MITVATDTKHRQRWFAFKCLTAQTNSPVAFAFLEKALNDPNPNVREIAALALGREYAP